MPSPATRDRKRRRDPEDDRSSDGDDDGRDLEGFIVDDAAESKSEVSESKEDDETLQVKEAEKITAGLNTTVVGGRVLRNRAAIKKPEPYFDHAAYEKLMAEDDKKEKIAMLKRWAADGDYVCPVLDTLTKKTPADVVDAEYAKAKEALGLGDSDDEEEEDESSEAEEDSSFEAKDSSDSDSDDDDDAEDDDEDEDAEDEES